MKKQLKNSIKALVILPFAILGIAWICMFPALSPSFLLGIGFLLFGIAISCLIGGKLTNIALLFSSLMFGYLVGEGVSYAIDPYVNASGFNKKSTKFDPIRGYRWLGDSIRGFRTRMGVVVYDNHFYPNNEGWIMNQDYTYKKKDSTRFRWMILGDSFVAGIMLQTNLPNRTQQLLNDSLGVGKIEIYSFGVDGGGIMNWYNVFFKEILPNYEFDGIIIAPYADNLYRDFMVMMIDTNGFMGRIDSVEWSEGDSPKMSDFKELKPYTNVYSDIEIEHFLSHPLKPFDWPLRKQLKSQINNWGRKGKNNTAENIKTIDQLQDKMGSIKFTQLDSIISWCQSNQKQLVLASIPSKEELKNNWLGERNQHKVEMDIIAKEYQLEYLDGYAVFKDLNEVEIDSRWLKYDGHWNQKGSDEYATELANYLISIKQ